MDIAKNLWVALGLPEASLSRLKLTEHPDPAINSSFKLGLAAQTSIALSGLAAAQFQKLRTGIEQDVTVDPRHAVLQFHSEAYYTIDGKLPGDGGGLWDELAGLYPTKDNSFVRIHTIFPHHQSGILQILNIPDSPPISKSIVAQALLQWNAVDFETEAAKNGMCATALRSFDEWDKHPQAKALKGTPPVTLTKIGDAPKRALAGKPTRPLDGIRVLDLSRVLAGPIAGRTLAAHGADVLLVTSPNLPVLPLIDVETSLGKRTTQLDLNNPSDHAVLRELAKDSDVFLQAYRPGGLEERKFGTKDLAALRPGIVYANLTAWGWDGPWKDRRGFDSLVQTASGSNVAEADAYEEFLGSSRKDKWVPKPLPMQALDHAAGYLLAFGVNAALCKTVTEGGSWEVRVSLAAVGQWIRSLRRIHPEEAFGKGRPFPPRTVPMHPEVDGLCVNWRSAGGDGQELAKGEEVGLRHVRALRQAAILSKTPVREGDEGKAPMVLGRHEPVWLARSGYEDK